MGWIRKTSPYLLLLLIALISSPNIVNGCPKGSTTTNTRVFTTLQEQNQTVSSDIIRFNKNTTLDGGSVINVTGLLKHENATAPHMYFGKRYPLNATITPQRWGAYVDRVHEIRFILRLLGAGAKVLSSLERNTFAEARVLNESIHITVFFAIPQDAPELGEVTTAVIVLAVTEGKTAGRNDVTTETELFQFPLDLSEGPSLVGTSPVFVLDEFQAVDGTILRISGNITVEEGEPPVWYYGTLYAIGITVEVLEWGWDASGTVQRIHDMGITLEFIGNGGVSVHLLSVPTDPSEIIVIHAPITHKFAYSVSEQDVKSLETVFMTLQLQFKEEFVDPDGKTHQDETNQELTRFLLNLKERSTQRGLAFSKTAKLSKQSLVNVEGILNLENTTPPLLYFEQRYSLTVNITVLQWGQNVNRLHEIKFFLDIVGGGGAVLMSFERDTIPGEILELNSPLHTTIFFRLQREMIPTTENVELIVKISLKEGVENAPDVENHEEMARFSINLEEKPLSIANSPNFTLEVEGMDGTIVQVTGNITVEEAPQPFWYYKQDYTIRTKLEVLEWGWDARGLVRRIHHIQVLVGFIGGGGVPVHSKSIPTDPSEIIEANAPVIHEFAYSVSKNDVNSLNSVSFSLQLSFTEEILDQNEVTTQEVTRFPLELREKPGEGTNLNTLLTYGGLIALIIVIGIVGRKLLKKREDDYWLK